MNKNSTLQGPQNEYISVLKRSEIKYRTIYEYAPLAYQSLNNKGKIIDVNPMWLKTLGYKREKVIGLGFEDFLHPDDVPKFKKRFRYFKENGSVSNVSFRLRHSKDYFIDIMLEGNASYNEDGSFGQTYCVFKDITDFKNIHDELIENQRKLNTLLDNLKGIAYRCHNDLNWTMEYFSRGFEELTGYKADEVIYNRHISYSDLILPDDRERIWDEVQEAINKNKGYDLQYRIKKRTGEVIYVSEKGVAVRSPETGEVIALEGFINDITKLKNTEDELRKALRKAKEADRLKSAFLANMSHEIRTPMNGILGFTELMKDPRTTIEEKEKYLSIIETSGKRMMQTLSDIMDISRIEAGEVQVNVSEFTADKLMEEILYFFEAEAVKKNLALRFEKKDNKSTMISSDREKIYSVISNLVDNAIKYTEEGEVIFGYDLVDQNEITIFVRDTGQGIKKNQLGKVFDRFVRADNSKVKIYDGVGLGLSISKAYVNLLGGKIRVKSTFGEGSEFTFSIPLIFKK